MFLMVDQKHVFVVGFQAYQDLPGKFYLNFVKNAYEVNRRVVTVFSKNVVTFALALKNQVLDHCVKSIKIRSFFWSVFSFIRTEYRDLLRKSPYSLRIQENTGQKLFTQWMTKF